MPFDERCRSNPFRFALFGDGVEQLFLFSGMFDRISRKIVSFEAIMLSIAACIVSSVHSSLSGVSANASLKRLLNVVSMSFEQVVNPLYIIGGNASVAFLEMADDERNVDFRHDRFQFQHIRAVVERTCRRREHLLHHVALATGEDEVAVAQLLNMRSQLCLDIFLRILSDLLKLVDSYDTRLVRMGEVLENFIQRIFRSVDVAQLDVESRHARDGVEAEFAADGLDGLNKQRCHLSAAGQKGFVYLAS